MSSGKSNEVFGKGEGDETEIAALTETHRRERKELQAKIQSLKKSASKGDKKKRKEVLEEIAKLEIDLDNRQLEELNKLNNVTSVVYHTCKTKEEFENSLIQNDEYLKKTDEVNDAANSSQQRMSKAQKRREKKEREELAKAAEILQQEELNQNGPRMQETRAINKILKDRGLSLHVIASDGDCLYNAIRHQLELTGHRYFKNETPKEQIAYLRDATADYILKNKESLIFYMTNPETGDVLSDDEYQNYCELIRTTAAWGGEIEIKALANILKVPIEILQATGPPTIQTGDSDNVRGQNLTIIYHRHMFSLGEHYNSTKPYVPEDDDEEAEFIGGHK